MELLGLFGQGIGKSYSPAIHAAALRETGRAGQYMLWPVASQDLPAAVRGAHLLGARGANVTTPHKENAAALCVRLDPWAREIGAVNTLVREDGGFAGYNTDSEGFWQPLAALSRPIRSALVLGTGGAALAVCAALRRAGTDIAVAGRRGDRLARFNAAFGAEPLEWSRRTSPREIDLIVNATTVGAKGGESPMDEQDIPAGVVVYDLIYRRTPLQEAALRRGCQVLGGGGMLLAQAELAWRLWYNEHAPHSAMAEALEAAMRSDTVGDKGEQACAT